MGDTQSQPKPATPPTRFRSFRGCITCRSHHVKCDETRPTCTTCAQSGTACGGYDKRIFFNAQDDSVVRYRQLLFTDEERVVLNLRMLKTVPFHKANQTLSSIDSWSESDQHCGINIGPFGAFKIQRFISSPKLWQTTPPEQPFEYSLAHDELTFNFDDSTMPTSFQVPTSPIAVPQTTISTGAGEESLWQTTFENAPLLLKHYADTLIPMMTPIRHQKTPWHVLFLPSTKNTLATITLGQPVTAADLTTFFGTLALSAFALQNQFPSPEWSKLSQIFKTYATTYLQTTLEHALDMPKCYKYKSIIMAILTMAQVSMVDGSWDQTDELLIAAEKVIRLRGLTKVCKSRKVRILHHCYAYARLIQESISMTSSRSSRQLELADAVERSGVIIKGSDPPFFCLGLWQNLEKDFMSPKSWEAGENDLHLASPGLWEATLYDEIFDVPETWLNLLSQVIRLANVKHTTEAMNSDILLLGEFTTRSKALERYISSHARTIATRIKSESHPSTKSISSLMQGALYSGLLIYFYRRVYDIESTLLQSEVLKVKEYLSSCQLLCEGIMIDTLMWPAFVAGCEAADFELQDFFATFFDSMACFTKQSAYGKMRELMHQVWEQRRAEEENPTSWIQLLDILHAPQPFTLRG